MRILAQLPVLLILAATPALAGDFFAYEQDNGTLAFSDEFAKVPARYRSEVERRSSQTSSLHENLLRRDCIERLSTQSLPLLCSVLVALEAV